MHKRVIHLYISVVLSSEKIFLIVWTLHSGWAKGKVIFVHAMKAYRRNRSIGSLFVIATLDAVEQPASVTDNFTAAEKKPGTHYAGYTQKNGAVSKVKKFISHLTRAQRTPSAAATVQVSHALITVLQCVLPGSQDTHPHGNQIHPRLGVACPL
jgi:hypothetical protein